MEQRKNVKIILFILMLFTESTSLPRGCCSWHGGILLYNPFTGRVICNDGTKSPTCTGKRL